MPDFIDIFFPIFCVVIWVAAICLILIVLYFFMWPLVIIIVVCIIADAIKNRGP